MFSNFDIPANFFIQTLNKHLYKKYTTSTELITFVSHNPSQLYLFNFNINNQLENKITWQSNQYVFKFRYAYQFLYSTLNKHLQKENLFLPAHSVCQTHSVSTLFI